MVANAEALEIAVHEWSRMLRHWKWLFMKGSECENPICTAVEFSKFCGDGKKGSQCARELY